MNTHGARPDPFDPQDKPVNAVLGALTEEASQGLH